MSTKLDLFLDETRRTYDLSTQLIQSYTKKINQLFIMGSTLLGILFIVTSILFNTLVSKKLLLNLHHWNVVLWLLFLVLTGGATFFILYFCIKGLKKEAFSVSNPRLLFDKYGSYTSEALKTFLIIQIGHVYNKNAARSNAIRSCYSNGLDALTYAIVSFGGYLLFTFLLLFSIYAS